jgi:hypothetical protein
MVTEELLFRFIFEIQGCADFNEASRTTSGIDGSHSTLNAVASFPLMIEQKQRNLRR